MKVSVGPVQVDFKIEIAPGMVTDRFVNCYLILGDGVHIIDSGVKGSERLLLQKIKDHGYEANDVKAIIHTHAHPDHMGSTKRLKELTGCSVLVHDAEAEWLERPERQFEQRPVPGFFDLIGGGVRPDRSLTDGDVIDMGKLRSMEVIHVPGHSPGSIALFHELTGSLFLGDAVPVPGHVPVYDDAVLAYRSILRLMEVKGVDLVCLAWEAPRRRGNASEILQAGLKVMESIHELVRTNLLTKGMTSEELCRRCVAKLGLPPEMANPLIARTFDAHRRALDEGHIRLA
jgi:glyoxylase-like metal-dependent hydrolase (beta-lactamase superfamily II)